MRRISVFAWNTSRLTFLAARSKKWVKEFFADSAHLFDKLPKEDDPNVAFMFIGVKYTPINSYLGPQTSHPFFFRNMLLTRKQTEARTWFLHNQRSVFYIILVFSLWDQMYRVRDLFNKSGCLIISGRLTDRPGKTEAIKWTDHLAAVLTQTSVLTVRAGKRRSCCSVLSRSCTHSETFPVMLGVL